jgi:tetratricopeptide (TPR) repeat protein
MRLIAFLVLLGVGLFVPGASVADPADALFRYATNAYYAGNYSQAAVAFSQAAGLRPAGGTLQNLGNAEWLRGRIGEAVLAWEQSLWLDPFNGLARSNLRFARHTAQLEAPDLSWYEVVSSWLPANWWAWVAGFSLWTAVGISTVPGILRWRKSAWQQAVAAFGLALFLLSLPAHLGVSTRARLGFILFKDVPLRLTPTTEAQFITRLGAGEPARLERKQGNYLLIQASHTTGWVQRDQFRLIGSKPISVGEQAQNSTNAGDGLTNQSADHTTGQ